MSVKHKVSGFFSALAIAVVSFFVIYLFIPEYSEKYLGTSFRSDKEARKTVSKVTTELIDKDSTSVTDRISDFFKN